MCYGMFNFGHCCSIGMSFNPGVAVEQDSYYVFTAPDQFAVAVALDSVPGLGPSRWVGSDMDNHLALIQDDGDGSVVTMSVDGEFELNNLWASTSDAATQQLARVRYKPSTGFSGVTAYAEPGDPGGTARVMSLDSNGDFVQGPFVGAWPFTFEAVFDVAVDNSGNAYWWGEEEVGATNKHWIYKNNARYGFVEDDGASGVFGFGALFHDGSDLYAWAFGWAANSDGFYRIDSDIVTSSNANLHVNGNDIRVVSETGETPLCCWYDTTGDLVDISTAGEFGRFSWDDLSENRHIASGVNCLTLIILE